MSFTLTIVGDNAHPGPVANAVVFVDGIKIAEAVSSVTLTGSHEITVKADGFDSYSFTAVADQEDLSVVLATSVQDTSPVNFVLKVFPEDIPSVGYTFTPIAGGSPITGAMPQEGPAVVSLSPGQYHLTVSAESYFSGHEDIDTARGLDASIQLKLVMDAKSTLPNSPQLPPSDTPVNLANRGLVDVGGNPIAGRNVDLARPEATFIYPNSVDGKYFTTSQARVYIGNLFVDEVNYVQFMLQDNKVPLFGYRSRYFDAVGQGRSLVQGQLGLNFVSEGYLYTALQEYDRMAQAGIQIDGKEDSLAELASLDDREQTEQVSLRRRELLQLLPESAVDGLKKRRQFKARNDNGYINAVYQDVSFTLELELEGGGRTIRRRLENCFLTANEQVYDQSGNALMDGYSFIARRLR